MKRLFYSFWIFLLFSFSALAQNEGISFQGLARNAAGEVMVSKKISLRLSILLGSESGAVAYTETRQTTTNPQGIFAVVLGDNTALTKSTNFSTIDWSTAQKFIKVEMDPNAGTNFTAMGTTKLQAVPLAYYAFGVDAENVDGILPVSSGGTGVASMTELKTKLGLDVFNNAALDTKVDKVAGKGLSTNDYSTAEKSKLEAITGTNTGDQDLSGYATTTQLATKANASDVTAGLANKVDKENGKGLSSNDYTTAEKTKLAAISGNVAGPQGPAGPTGLPGAVGATGPAGPQGVAGPAGNDGAVGPQGATGAQGPIGLTGPAGATGPQGPIGLTGPSGNDGAVGPQGVTGAQGPIGAAGANGKTVINGSTDPAAGTGQDGDFYINTATNTLFGPKVSGAWPSGISLVGPQGATGSAGAQGIQGPTGATGPAPAGTGIVTVNNGSLQTPGALTGDVTTSGLAATIGAGRVTNDMLAGSISLTSKVTGTLPVANGGTGLSTTPANGQLDIGNGSGFTRATLTAGTGISITNASGAITIASSGGSSGVPYTGATGAVNLGAYDLTVNGIAIGKGRNSLASNTRVGVDALKSISTGAYNDAFGNSSMRDNTTGEGNSAFGFGTLSANSSGSFNTALGLNAMMSNTTGGQNIAIGAETLVYNSTGTGNTGIGFSAARGTTTGSANTSIGWRAGGNVTTGAKNTFLGYSAGNNVSTGTAGNTTGLNSVMIGYDVRPLANGDDNEIVISGYNGSAGTVGLGSNTTLIGSSTTTSARIMGALNLPNTTASSSTTTGALTVAGGVGIAGALNAGGTLTAGTVTYPNTHGTANQVLSTTGSGTLAWTTPASGGVPYAGATQSVNLGAYDLTVNGLIVGKGNGNVSSNIAFGTGALSGNVSSSHLIGIGNNTLAGTVGVNNIAIGANAVLGGSYSIGIGKDALANNGYRGNSPQTDVGNRNIAIGDASLKNTGRINDNISIGYQAMGNAGQYLKDNVAIGTKALYSFTGYHSDYIGGGNTAIGFNSAYSTYLGDKNTFIGYQSGYNNTNGYSNTSIGASTLLTNTTGTRNTAIGFSADVASGALTNATAIGYGAIVVENNTIQLGNTSVTLVKTSGTVNAGGFTTSGSVTAASYITSSDLRLKSNISPLANSLATVMQLNPVHYVKKESLASTTSTYTLEENGFIAQEIQKILPYLVQEGTDKDKLLSLNYVSLIPLLTKAIQEQQAQIEELQSYKTAISSLQKELEEIKKLLKGQEK